MNFLEKILTLIPIIFYQAGAFSQSNYYTLINKDATDKATALYENMQWYKGKGIMFGHEDDLATGVNWKNEEGRSDIMEVCDDFPAVFGWDVSKIGLQSTNRDGIDFQLMNQWMQLVYKSGGVNTITWMMDNPVTDRPGEDLTPAIHEILPNGSKHEFYVSRLDQLSNYLENLNLGKSENKLIPIIFRPFPQNDEKEFWWSRGNCTAEEYKQLWQFTTTYLLEKKGLKTLIFAYSSSNLNSKEEFFEYYPGDEYVDIIGLNLYDSGEGEFENELSNKLLTLNAIGLENNKVTAITETGYRKIPSNDWWTEKLMKGIFRDRTTANISYVMVGKNVSSEHFYAPYAEHSSAENFKQLYNNMYTLFLEDIPDVYVSK